MLSAVETVTYTHPKKESLWRPHDDDRKLIFDPRQAIADGESVIATLNQTIAHTERSIAHYETQFQRSIVVCNDYAGMYDSLYLVSVGMALLLFAHFILFGAHTKFFTAWFYEAKGAK